MEAIKDRFPYRYSTGFVPTCESEGSGSSGRIDAEIIASEDSNAPRRKCIKLNLGCEDSFGIPLWHLPVSKLSTPQRKELVFRLRSELENIQAFQKKVELQRTNAITVSSSSDILSCSNVQNGPKVQPLKKPAVLNSGPGKKLKSSSKARGWNRGTSGRFESTKVASTPSTLNAIVMKQCDNLLKKLMAHNYGYMFNDPVDLSKYNIPDYFTVIKHPMDLGTIKKKLTKSDYSSPWDFLADVRLTFSNAMTYNPPGNDVHMMADTLSKFFEVRWKVIEKKIPEINVQPKLEKRASHKAIETIKPMPPLKKRKISSAEHKTLPETVKLLMSIEEKHNLSSELEALLEELPDNIIEFLKEQTSNGRDGVEDEIEIDIDALSDDTLFTLRKLLDDYVQRKQNNHEKVEPCEIELPNESGLSNSSIQLYKGIDPVEEEVDIGGNEPPISSYPPVEVEKETSQRSDKLDMPDSDSSSSESESDGAEATIPRKLPTDNGNHGDELDQKAGVGDLADGNQSVSGLDQLEQNSQQKPSSVEADCYQDGVSALTERQVSPEKLYRVALLKNRFADTILKAREKTLNQGEKGDPEKLRREREELELQKRKEKARFQAEAKAAEYARRQAEAEAAAKAKQKRELDRETARQALLQMEKTIEINENSRFLEDLEMLRVAPPEQLPSSADETSPDHSQDRLGSFKFGGSNPLEQLGLFMKMDDEEDEGEPPSFSGVVNDVEEGEID